MGETEYSEALKLGKKEYRARIAKGQFPYLPVLDEILSEADIQTEQNMGLVHVPLDFVVGTSTMGRTYSFAANFMPILDWETEFAVKWSNLSDAQMNEGFRCRNKHHGKDIFICGKFYADIGLGNRICSEVV